MKSKRVGAIHGWALLGMALLLASCGGGDGSFFSGLNPDTKSFYAYSYADNTVYQLRATKVGEGAHCYIYLEEGNTLNDGVLPVLLQEFDNTIYPIDTTRFGSEPNPGADGDPKIYILLLNIRQPLGPGTGVGGLFSPSNEYPRSQIPTSNQKEMFYCDLPTMNGNLRYGLRVLAHEFQHMIHWEQKDHLRLNLTGHDDIWLNEAMSEAAAIYCYGTDPGRVYDYAFNTSDALTLWHDQVDYRDYASVAMWSQYLIDRIPDGSTPDNNIFRRSLQSSLLGRPSVDNALVPIGKTFTDVFVDWTIANLVTGINVQAFIDNVRAGGTPQWTYRDNLDITNYLFHIFRPDVGVLPSLPQWSSTYSGYMHIGSPGSVTWNPVQSQTTASFVDYGNFHLTASLPPATPVSYTDFGYLAVRNATGQDNTTSVGDNVVFAAPAAPQALTAEEYIRSTLRFPGQTGPAVPPSHGYVCDFQAQQEREQQLRDRGLRVEF